jgi:PTS system ascorbate-specific IIB component
MIEMNIRKVLKELQMEAEVDHTDLSSASGAKADVYVATRDIAGQLVALDGQVISLDSMIDIQELREKISALLLN